MDCKCVMVALLLVLAGASAMQYDMTPAERMFPTHNDAFGPFRDYESYVAFRQKQCHFNPVTCFGQTGKKPRGYYFL